MAQNNRILFLIMQQSGKVLDHWQTETRPTSMESWEQKPIKVVQQEWEKGALELETVYKQFI